MNRITAMIVAVGVFGIAFMHSPASAATLSGTNVAPTVDGADIANLSGGIDIGGAEGHIWSDRPAQGQTFTTGSNAGGYLLNALTLQSLTSTGTNGFTVRVGSVAGTVFTPIATETTANLGYSNGDYLTATLDTPLMLAANTTYGFDWGSPGTNGFVTSNSNANPYSGGAAYTSGAGGIGDASLTLHDGISADRLFHLDLSLPAAYKSIQFDVSDNAGSYSGTQAPAHAAGELGGGDSNWNTVEGDVSGTFVHTDGSDTGNLMVDFGRQDGGTGAIDWSLSTDGPVGNAAIGSGVEDTALMEDWLFTNGNDLGVRVKGLAAGIYDIYALVREPDQQGRTYDVGIGVDTDDTTEIGDLDVSSIGGGVNGASWAEGANYVVQRVAVSGVDDWVVIIVDPTNAPFGTLGGFQIVAVPAPAALPAGLALIGLVAARRRRA